MQLVVNIKASLSKLKKSVATDQKINDEMSTKRHDDIIVIGHVMRGRIGFPNPKYLCYAICVLPAIIHQYIFTSSILPQVETLIVKNKSVIFNFMTSLLQQTEWWRFKSRTSKKFQISEKLFKD